MSDNQFIIPKQRHECLMPIYDYIRKIKDDEPERAKSIARICYELSIELIGEETN